jgi:glycosyltransferase involved in cell wall biosynthesis
LPNPKVSICIPAYCEVDFLDAAIKSCLSQKFTNFELIVTDDTPNDSIEEAVSPFAASDGRVSYYRNLGTPGAAGNSNYAASKARGEWIKFLYQDDLFASDNALGEFVAYTDKADFIFSPCIQVKENTRRIYKINDEYYKKLRTDPVRTIVNLGNIIGAPSAIMIKKSVFSPFAENMVWKFDVSGYIKAFINTSNILCMDKPSIIINEHNRQLTERVGRDRAIDYKESMEIGRLLLQYKEFKISAFMYLTKYTIKFIISGLRNAFFKLRSPVIKCFIAPVVLLFRK